MRGSVSYFWVGVGIGCGTAILMAPQTGRKLRLKIKEEASRKIQRAKRSGNELRDRAVGLAQKGSRVMANRWDAAAAAINAGRHAYNRVVRGT
jgi:gas vesicle protein